MTTQTFPLAPTINLRVRLGHGSLTVTTADDLTEATVSLTPRDAASDAAQRIEVATNGPTLEVKLPRKGGLADLIGKWRHERDAVDAEITIPSGTALDLTTYTADITVRGRSGGADVTTGSAAIALGHVDGDVRVRGGRSNCRIDQVTGSAVARSGAGSVSFGEVGGSVQADFGSGDVEIGTARGSVRSRSGSGNARFDAVYGDVDFATGAGQAQHRPAQRRGRPARCPDRLGRGRLGAPDRRPADGHRHVDQGARADRQRRRAAVPRRVISAGRPATGRENRPPRSLTPNALLTEGLRTPRPPGSSGARRTNLTASPIRVRPEHEDRYKTAANRGCCSRFYACAARYRELMATPEECGHDDVDVTVSLRAGGRVEPAFESADRVDEVGICRLCGKRVKRGLRAGRLSAWEIDA